MDRINQSACAPGWLSVVVVLALALAGCVTQPGRYSAEIVFDAVKKADEAYALGHWEEAARHYRTVIQRVPQDAHAWFRLGNIRLRLGQYPAAVEAYQAVLAREPSWSKAWYNLSTAYLLQARTALTLGAQHSKGAGAERMARRLQALDGVLHPARLNTSSSDSLLKDEQP